MEDVIALILGGGRGTRLFPLTQHRSKPAVPIGGNYRLVDVAVSNCLHANLRRIFVVTQYQSESLNKHIGNTYKFDMFSNGFVEVLAAEQTEQRSDWFQGTADAVRQCLKHVLREHAEDIAILGGDQLYRLDFRDMLRVHRETKAHATVAILPVPAEQTSGFGIMKTDSDGRIVHFEEKPKAERLPDLVSPLPGGGGDAYLASMGIYIFNRRALVEALSNETHNDFGRHVIPAMLSRLRVQAYAFKGYWEDVGTIQSFYEANMALTRPNPPFSFYDARFPMFTHPRLLAPTVMQGCRITESLISEGCFIENADIESSVIGIRSRIGRGVKIRRSLILGADAYETTDEIEQALKGGEPPIGVGDDTIIDSAIIDKDARIGRGVRIINEAKIPERDGSNYFIREGLVIVPKGAVIPDGTVI
ncbi:MAG TPA: glucose-1-phosphate adenylyltransferase [Polyangia bacterium]